MSSLAERTARIMEKVNRLPKVWQEALRENLGGEQAECLPVGVGAANCHEAHCAAFDSLVETERGLQRFYEVIRHEEEASYEDVDYRVPTDQGLKQVVQTYNHGEAPTKKVRFRFGYQIEATHNHKVKNAEGEWVELRNLILGEKIRLQLGTYWPSEEVEIPNTYQPRKTDRYYGAGTPGVKEFTPPTRINADWAELLGWWTSEGYYSHAQKSQAVKFAVHGEDCVRIRELLTKVGLEWTEYKCVDKDDTWEITVYSQRLYHWFTQDLKMEGSAKKKHVPWVILQGTFQTNRAYMIGVMSGDGSANKQGYFVLNTVSKQLANEIQQVWRRLGVPTSLGTYGVKLTEKSRAFESAQKRGAVVGDVCTTKYELRTLKQWTHLIQEWLVMNPTVRERFAAQIQEKPWDPARQKGLLGWNEQAFRTGSGPCGTLLVGVEFIEDSVNRVKDFVIPENNTYILGGIVSHQTQGRWRERSLDKIFESAERAIRKQGAENVSFYSLTWSLHSQIYTLLLRCYARFGTTNLISQRADQASADPDFFKFQNANGERSATIGVEGISQRMRNYFNKSLHTDQLFQTVENAAHAGYQQLKWFMILSGNENEQDVEEFCELLREMSRRTKKIAKDLSKATGTDRSPIRINPSFMLLLTLPHTALQWAPCTSSFDLEQATLGPVVAVTKELGYGFRTSMTRERVRISQVSGMWGREATTLIADVGLRTGFLYFGPVQKKVTYFLEQKIHEAGYDWMYWFREKPWNHLFPWDGISTAMRRDYLWNQWRHFREYIGAAYCLRTSININPKCHDCGACGTSNDRQFMLTRKLESAEELTGKEAARRDMTVRKRVRWDLEITDEMLRVAPKFLIARNIVRAFMMASSEVEWDNEIVNSYLRMDGTSMKFVEGQGNQPYVYGHVLVDTVFNKNWPDEKMRSIIPRINEILADSYPYGERGMLIRDFVASDKLVNFDNTGFALYTVKVPVSTEDIQVAMEALHEEADVTYKERKSIGRDIFRMEEVTRLRSDVVPMAYFAPARGGTQITFLGNLTVNPIQILNSLTKKRPALLKTCPIQCLGYYRYDREKADEVYGVQEDDIFAIMEGRSTVCEITGEPIETDLFTGETYRSKSAPNLCLAADLKGVVKQLEHGVNLSTASVTK